MTTETAGADNSTGRIDDDFNLDSAGEVHTPGTLCVLRLGAVLDRAEGSLLGRG